MDFRENTLDQERQQRLAFLALAYALAEDEARADYIRTLARALYEAAQVRTEEKAAVTA